VARAIAQAAAQRHGVFAEARSLDAFAAGTGVEVGRRNSAALARIFLAAPAAAGAEYAAGAAPRGYLLTGRVDGYDEARDCVVEVKTRSSSADWGLPAPSSASSSAAAAAAMGGASASAGGAGAGAERAFERAGPAAHDIVQVRCYMEMARFRQERERAAREASQAGPAAAGNALRRRRAAAAGEAVPAPPAGAASGGDGLEALLVSLDDARAGAAMGQLVEQFAADGDDDGDGNGNSSSAGNGAGSAAPAGAAARRRVTLLLRDAREWAPIHAGLLAACADLQRFGKDAAFRESIVRAATLPVSLAGGEGLDSGSWAMAGAGLGSGPGAGAGDGNGAFDDLSFGAGFSASFAGAEAAAEGAEAAEGSEGDEGDIFRRAPRVR
jgi:hypothetical protein